MSLRDSPILQIRIEQALKDSSAFDGQNLAGLCYLSNSATPVLQDGPQCGLVALSMTSSMLGILSNLSVSHIFDAAVKKKYTNNGEMFSAVWLSDLSSALFSCNSKVLETFPTATDICNLISQPKTALLVPYDCDKNHQPANLKGHSAHWSLIVGFLLVYEAEETDNTLKWIDAGEQFEESFRKCYLLALHGKSKHAALWEYEQLKESNANLLELGEKRRNDGLSYVLPGNGLQDLRGKMVVLENY